MRTMDTQPDNAHSRPRAESLEDIVHGIGASDFLLPGQKANETHTATSPPAGGPTKRYSNGAKPITRNRASYSCHACRRRKVKCDKVHPICGNCSKTGDECLYDATAAREGRGSPQASGPEERHGTKRRRRSQTRSAAAPYEARNVEQSGQSTPAGGRSIEERLDFLMMMVERLSRNSGGVADESLEELSREGSAFMELYGSRNKPENSRSQQRPGASKSRTTSMERTAESSIPDTPTSTDRAAVLDGLDSVEALNLGHLSLQEGGRSRYVGTTFWAYISDEIDQLNQLLRDQNRAISPEAPAHTHPEGSQDVRMQHSSHERADHRMQSDLLAPAQGTAESGFTKSMLFQTEDSPSSTFDGLHAEMLQNMPTKRQSHVLYRCFMSGVHLISPIIHPPSVLEQYHAFWEWHDNREHSSENCPDPSFIPLLYAIWYGGAVSISIKGIKKEFGDTSRQVLSTRLHDEVTRCLTLISFPRNPTLSGLIAFLIVQTILAREEEPLTSSLFIGLAVRTAQMMGLHRDPEQFGLPPSEAEARRRMWWHVVHMDGVVALSSGLPPLVSDESYWDVREISEVKDAFLGTVEAEQYERDVASKKRQPDKPDEPLARIRKSMVDVSYVVARGKGIMACLTRKILRLQLGTKPLTRNDMKYLRDCLKQAEKDLSTIVNRIPTRGIPEMCLDPSAKNYKHHPFEYDPALATSPTTEELNHFSGTSPVGWLNNYTVDYHFNNLKAFHKWARILLSLFIDKAYCVAYQPFLKNVKSKIWPSARQGALRHCHGFMKKFIALATDPAFQSFQWSWPGNHQPMHATMIMLIDLYERPTSPEASRSRAFIDQVFALSGPDGGVVGGEDGVSVQRPLREGGREAWTMLRRLREKAWQKAGLDPGLLWTEQDQIDAGVAKPLSEHELMVRELREGSLTTAALEGKIDVADLMRSLTADSEEPDDHSRQARPGPSLAHNLYSLIKASQAHADNELPPISSFRSASQDNGCARKASISSHRSNHTDLAPDMHSPQQSIPSPPITGTTSPPFVLSHNPHPSHGSPEHRERNWGIIDPMTGLWSDSPQQYSSRTESGSHRHLDTIPQQPRQQPQHRSQLDHRTQGIAPHLQEHESRNQLPAAKTATGAMPYLSTILSPAPAQPQVQIYQPGPPSVLQATHELANSQATQNPFGFLDGMDVTAAAASRSPQSSASIAGLLDTFGPSLSPQTRQTLPPLPTSGPTSMANSSTNLASMASQMKQAAPDLTSPSNLGGFSPPSLQNRPQLPRSQRQSFTDNNNNNNDNDNTGREIAATTDTNTNINVNFDWDQWDAVFGQYVMPLDDYMNMEGMDLDEQSGFMS